MSMSDPLGDMLTRIRNAQSARQSRCKAPASKLRENVLEVLKREGYIRAWRTEELRPGIRFIDIELKYSEGEPAIKEITRISKPGRRVYSKIAQLPKVYNGLGTSSLTPFPSLSLSERAGVRVFRSTKGLRPFGVLVCPPNNRRARFTTVSPSAMRMGSRSGPTSKTVASPVPARRASACTQSSRPRPTPKMSWACASAATSCGRGSKLWWSCPGGRTRWTGRRSPATRRTTS